MIGKFENLADFDHPLVIKTTEHLTKDVSGHEKMLEQLFYYVRDGIKFMFPLNGDLVKASETIQLGGGQCNTKSALFLALCKAAGITARAHFSGIKKEIQHGLFVGLGYHLLPDILSHSWLEVRINNTWREIDTYINDHTYFIGAMDKLKQRGWETGFSISCMDGNCSDELNLEQVTFVQMAAVTADYGAWEEPAEFYASDLYRNRPGKIKQFAYQHLIGKVNRRVEKIREQHTPLKR